MLWDAVHMLPDSFPFVPVLKNISRALASESPGNLMLYSYIASSSDQTF